MNEFIAKLRNVLIVAMQKSNVLSLRLTYLTFKFISQTQLFYYIAQCDIVKRWIKHNDEADFFNLSLFMIITN